MAAADKVDVIGAVVKLDTFTSKGGGFHIKVECPSDPTALAALAQNAERIADITFAFRETYSNEEEGENGDLFEGDEE